MSLAGRAFRYAARVGREGGHPFEALAACARALREELLASGRLGDGTLDVLDADVTRGGEASCERIASGAAQLFTYGALCARLLGASAEGQSAARALAERLGGDGLAAALVERVGVAARGCEAASRIEALVRELPNAAAHASVSYDEFLARHDPALRRARGVYYTPTAVARFVVERVDRVLCDELGLTRGIAATHDEKGARLDVLDPAAGTGAFLAEVVRFAHRRLDEHGCREGLAPGARALAWSGYVRSELLPRLHAIELMPVAYVLCHLRLALALDETGHRLAGDERLRIHLGDALVGESAREPRGPLADLLAAEQAAASRLVRPGDVGVVLTNPPYRRGARPSDLSLAAYKLGLETERNLQPLSDDHVRFVRLAEVLLGTRDAGVLGLVGNATMSSGHLYRGMRRSLLETFDRIDVVDLHGSSKVRRRAPGALRDENVFDVGQGIALAILRRVVRDRRPIAEVRYTELWGPRAQKEAELCSGLLPVPVTLAPRAPTYAFVPREEVPPEYARFLPLDALFSFHSVGAKPGDDQALVGFDSADVRARLDAARAAVAGAAAGALSEAGRKLARMPPEQALDPRRVAPYAYRPFDTRAVYDDPALWTRPVAALRAHVDGEPLLLVSRVVNDFAFAHVFVTRLLPDVISLSSTTSGNCHVFPASCLRVEEATRALGIAVPVRVFFAYLYALLHSPSYRARYGAALVLDYPRVPLPRAPALFDALAALGERLLELHLLEAPLDAEALPRFVDGGDRRLTRARGGELVEDAPGGPRLYVNASSYFAPVSRACWDHRIGGHPVLKRWLAERKRAGRLLGDDDVSHLCRVVVTLDRSRELTLPIDGVIESHGGWPAAFAGCS